MTVVAPNQKLAAAPGAIARDRRPAEPKAPAVSRDVRVVAKAQGGAEVKVSGPWETVRTGFAIGLTALGPFVAGRQALQTVASTSSAFLPVRIARGAAQGTLGLVSRLPFANHPAVPKLLHGAERALPWLASGLLVFDSLALYQTLTDKQATTTRKALAGARWACTAASTALFFVPNRGAMFAKIFSKGALGFDIAVKKLDYDAKSAEKKPA